MNRIRDIISEELLLIENNFFALTKQKNDIFNDLDRFVRGKSKRVRSILCLLYLKAYGKVINENIVNLLSAVELIHNASLLHDDVIDDSPERRGIPTLFNKYGAKMSVLSGDFIMVSAVENLLKLSNNEILSKFMTVTKEMSSAEIEQFINRKKDISIERYLDIAYGKTASLFVAALGSSAILSGLDEKIAEQFGKIFGLLFQVCNDMEELSHHNDEINGVKTPVDILGIEKTIALKDNYKEELSRLLANLPDNQYRQGIEDLIKLL